MYLRSTPVDETERNVSIDSKNEDIAIVVGMIIF